MQQELLPVLTIEKRIEASDVDLVARMKPSAMLLHAQELAGIHATSWGYPHDEMVKNGNFFILSRILLQMPQYPRFNQNIRIETWISPVRRSIFARYFRFLGAKGNELVRLSTIWMICDIASRKAISAQQAGVVLPDLDFPPPLEQPGRLVIPEKNALSDTERKCVYSDLDYNKHMNNARYADWVCDMFDAKLFEEQCLSQLQINFLAEVNPGDVVQLSSFDVEDGFFVQGDNNHKEKRIFQAHGIWRSES